ncbi:MAG: 3TM-type holin [Syntrophus sp. (in: bacteria)]|nr:3TM-type holin [Syntrophus sp. (in: bacteria)]
MGLLPNLVAGGAGELLKGIGSLAKDIRQAVTGQDPELEKKVLDLEAAAAQAQAQINLMEAQHPSVFVAGWRPAIGWICACGLAWKFIIHPLFIWVMALSGANIKPPIFPDDGLFGLVMALLGIGGMRTYEKLKDVNRRH